MKLQHLLLPILLLLKSTSAQSLVTEDPADPDGPSVSVAADLLVGDSVNPKELHVHGDTLLDGNLGLNGSLSIGTSTSTPSTGAIRWTGSDFEGYNGTAWKSLTKNDAGILRGPNLSITWGQNNSASQFLSTTWGNENTASSPGSTAWGYSNTASNFRSTAWGVHNTASGRISTAMGFFNNAESSFSTVLGRFNIGGFTIIGEDKPYKNGNFEWYGSDPLFEIGAGTAEADRANAFTVLKDGRVAIGKHSALPNTAPEDLQVQGSIKLGSSSGTPSAGAIRWTGSDFEGYDGTAWKSLTRSLADQTGTLRDPNDPDNAVITAKEDEVTIDSDLKTNGNLALKDSITYQSVGDEIVYFKWSRRVPFAPTLPDKVNTSLPNQAIYVDLGNKWVWGALTVTLVGDHHTGKNTGIIRKTFAIGRNPNWTNTNDGEQLELALGPITERYKVGAATSESGKLRIPIYKIADTRNRVTVFVEGHLSLAGKHHNFDPKEITFTDWETTNVDHIAERIHFNAENITADLAQFKPLGARPQNPTAGSIYYDSEAADFQGYDGTVWKSLTVSLPSGPQGDLSMGPFTAN